MWPYFTCITGTIVPLFFDTPPPDTHFRQVYIYGTFEYLRYLTVGENGVWNELVIHEIRNNTSAIFHNFLFTCCKVEVVQFIKNSWVGGSWIAFFSHIFCIFAKVELQTSRYFAKRKRFAILEIQKICNSRNAKDLHVYKSFASVTFVGIRLFFKCVPARGGVFVLFRSDTFSQFSPPILNGKSKSPLFRTSKTCNFDNFVVVPRHNNFAAVTPSFARSKNWRKIWSKTSSETLLVVCHPWVDASGMFPPYVRFQEGVCSFCFKTVSLCFEFFNSN